jgi:DNA polymerase-3 subunit epsilon
LTLARSLHPGQRNGLDALCKRYSVDNSKRELHGALLDAGILVDVYLAMTGGQSALALAPMSQRIVVPANAGVATVVAGIPLAVPAANLEELERHEAMLDLIHKASGGKAVWRAVEERLS